MGRIPQVTTQRGGHPADAVPEDVDGFARPGYPGPDGDSLSWAGVPAPREAGEPRGVPPSAAVPPAPDARSRWDAPPGVDDGEDPSLAVVALDRFGLGSPAGASQATGGPGDARAGDGRAGDGRGGAPAGLGHAAGDGARKGAFDPANTGTWRMNEVVPGAEGGRRTTTILRYLMGRLAVDQVRRLTRWAFVVPLAGALLLLVRPRWIGAAVLGLGVLLLLGRVVAVRLLERVSLARRFRPVEEDLRGAVEAGKANLRGELRRVGLPSGAWALPLSVLRLARGSARSRSRSRLREVDIDRVLPRAQLERALRVLDRATPTR
jgi:hypothetical protein